MRTQGRPDADYQTQPARDSNDRDCACRLRPGRRGRRPSQTIRIGVLNDQSGPFRDIGGPGSVAATRQAVKEFGDHGFAVDVIFADHQNKPDVGVSIARQWCDTGGVDMLLDLPNSSVALAVNGVAREKNKVLVTSVGRDHGPDRARSARPTPSSGRSIPTCSRKPRAPPSSRRAGIPGISSTPITSSVSSLRAIPRASSPRPAARCSARRAYPFPGTADFSSFLLQAQSSGAKVLGFANAGADLINCIKQAREFGLNSSMRLTALEMFIPDVHGLGLNEAQGIVLCSPFYWDLNDRTRAFTRRLLRDQKPTQYPNMDHAGCYAGTLHYLKAVAAMGADKAKADGKAVVAQMKAMPCR